MEFVQNFTPPDFTPSVLPNLNSFSKKKHKKWMKMEKFTPLAKILHCRRHWRHWQIPPLIIDILIKVPPLLHCVVASWSTLVPSWSTALDYIFIIFTLLLISYLFVIFGRICSLRLVNRTWFPFLPKLFCVKSIQIDFL